MAFCPQLVARIKTDPAFNDPVEDYGDLLRSYQTNLENSLENPGNFERKTHAQLAAEAAAEGQARRSAAVEQRIRAELAEKRAKKPKKSSDMPTLALAFAAAKTLEIQSKSASKARRNGKGHLKSTASS